MDYRRLFESSPAAILALEAAEPFRIVAVTDAYLEATGTRREAIVGRGIFSVFPDNPADPTANGVRNLRASLRRVAKQGLRDTMALQKYDIPTADPTGFKERWWSPTNSPVFGADGRLQYILHRVEDVTTYVCRRADGSAARVADLHDHLAALEAEIYARTREAQATNARLEAANARLAGETERKTEFLTALAHELRTPFAAMILRLEGLKRQRAAQADRFAGMLDKALEQAQRLKAFVDELLEFAQFGLDRGTSPAVPIELGALVRRIVELHTRDRPAPIEITGPNGALVGVWEPARLAQLVGNVVDNAVKFGDGQPIAVRLKREAGKALIQVEDHGIGIEPQKRAAIFERFVRAAPVDSYPGLGLGLAIAKESAAALGGTITVAPTPGGGSTFTVALPLF